MAALSGIVGTWDFAIFAAIIARFYHRGPDVPQWLRPARSPSEIPTRDTLTYIAISMALVIGVVLYALYFR